MNTTRAMVARTESKAKEKPGPDRGEYYLKN